MDDWLRDQRPIDVELADHRRMMPLVTCAPGERHDAADPSLDTVRVVA